MNSKSTAAVCFTIALLVVSALAAGSALAIDTVPLPTGVLPSDSMASIRPLIVGGELPDTPEMHVDPNTTDSPFAGVGSLFIDAAPVGDQAGFFCSGALVHGISPDKQILREYFITAAHCLDFAGGLDPSNNSTGDGLLDVAPEDVRVVLNFGSDFSHVIAASEIHLHPDWHGFLNASAPEGVSINDDIAVLRLSTPVPEDVPVYTIASANTEDVERINPVGYGETGDPNELIPNSAEFEIKRSGQNQIEFAIIDDELSGALEVYEADFDGPDESTNQFDIGEAGFDPMLEGTLGNEIEVNIAPGDSGSPSFLADFDTGELVLDPNGLPIIYANNTFGTVDAPAYGSILGGMFLPAYAEWIDSVMVPEPSSMGLLLLGAGAVLFSRRSPLR